MLDKLLAPLRIWVLEICFIGLSLRISRTWSWRFCSACAISLLKLGIFQWTI